MTLSELNLLTKAEAREALAKCCGASNWVSRLLIRRPFKSEEEIEQLAEEIWFSLTPKDWLEAFGHHPKIGDTKSLGKKFANTEAWSKDEQKSVEVANESILKNLVLLNEQYEKKFGYIFIVCATGKSASEILSLLKQRLTNSPKEELKIAMGEQNKITKLRLNKLLS
ncbi:MAG: 2-oxo-4-hydroxy-4-carboxy-5-ureidoimidazoline decarboxylase [Cyclobacteriaceae bacterium]